MIVSNTCPLRQLHHDPQNTYHASIQNSFTVIFSMHFIMSHDSDLPLTPAGGSSFYVPAHGSGEIVPMSLEDRHSSICTPCEETHNSSKETFEAIASSRRARRPIHSFHDGTNEGRNQPWAARDDFEFLLVDPNADHVLSPPRTFKRLLRPCPRKPGSDESTTSASHRHQLTWFQSSDPTPFDAAAEFSDLDASRDPFLCVLQESESLILDGLTDKSGYLPSFLPDLESVEMTGSPVRLSMKPLHTNRDIRSDVTCSTFHWSGDDPTKSFEGMPISLWNPMLPWSRPTSYSSTPEALHS